MKNATSTTPTPTLAERARVPNVLTRDEYAQLDLAAQTLFRTNNGTVTENPGYDGRPRQGETLAPQNVQFNGPDRRK